MIIYVEYIREFTESILIYIARQVSLKLNKTAKNETFKVKKEMYYKDSKFKFL